MRRKKASRPILDLLASGEIHKGSSILDFGCGRGEDVKHLRKLGYKAKGYDPHKAFGYSRLPKGHYGVVAMTYVINVIPKMIDRVDTIWEALSKVEHGGLLFIASRSRSEVEREAKKNRWLKDGAGYRTRAGTYQMGHSFRSLLELCRHPYLRSDVVEWRRLGGRQYTGILLATRRWPR